MIAYDGGPFAGWAAQPGQRTVQGELEAALETILPASPCALTVAGRTDAGVHATGPGRELRARRRVPAALASAPQRRAARRDRRRGRPSRPDGFDARRDARSRIYRYRVLSAADAEPVRERAGAVVAAIASIATPSPLRRGARGHARLHRVHPDRDRARRFEREVLRADWIEEPLEPPHPGELLELWIEADGFMRHMVRVLVGTMLEVAGGRRSIEDFRRLLDGRAAQRRRRDGPPHGLYLAAVRY